MTSSDTQWPASGPADPLDYFRKKGARLWAEQGELHFSAPKGALSQLDIERLRAAKDHILLLLMEAPGQQIKASIPEPSRQLRRAPLAFSQLEHWNLHNLRHRPAIRQIASATRLCGRLSINALQRSVLEIVRRHDALRTRIRVLDEEPMQETSEIHDCRLIFDDLSALVASHREVEVARLIEQLILEPIDISIGPLFGCRVVRLSDDEHVLIIAMEHMISDAASMGILLREILTAYTQAVHESDFSLPIVPIQFPDYAASQRNAHESWVETHSAYWNEHLTGCQSLRFSQDSSATVKPCVGCGTVALLIDGKLKRDLLEWSRQRRTTLAMTVFTAYVGLLLRWCNVSDAVIQFQIDGRGNPGLESAIGYFASVLYLRLRLLDRNNFADLASQVVSEYCGAYEHADHSFMAAQVSPPEFTRASAFNWLPMRSSIDIEELRALKDPITCIPLRFVHPMLRTMKYEHEPSIMLCDTDEGIIGDVYFSLDRFSMGTMERFGRNFLMFLTALVKRPEQCVKDIALVF